MPGMKKMAGKATGVAKSAKKVAKGARKMTRARKGY